MSEDDFFKRKVKLQNKILAIFKKKKENKIEKENDEN